MINKLKQRFHGDDLKARAMKGGFWLGLGGSSEQGMRFVRNIILARVLAPEAFGLMAIILAVNAAFESFTQIGIKEAVIQSPYGEEKTYLNGAWFTSVGRSLMLFFIGIISSPWIARFYEVPQHNFMLQISFVSILLNGTTSAGAYVSLKRMDYKRWAIITHGGGLIGILSAICLSFLLLNVWALVFGYLIEAAARCVLSFVLYPFVPRLHFDKNHYRELVRYARGMFGLPILYFIYAQTDIFVVGKLFQKNDLGLYSMVVTLAQAPSVVMTSLINPILMPVFSHKQKDTDWINAAIIKSTKVIMLAGAPLVLFAAFYGKDLLTVIYGSQYAIMVVPFVVHLATTIIRSASIPVFNLYLALGRPELHRLFSGIRAVFIMALIYPAIRWFGLTGAAFAVLLSTLIGLVFQVMRIRNLTGMDMSKYKSIIVEVVIFSLVVVFVRAATGFIPISSPLINILQGLIGCVIGYSLVISYMMKRKRGIFFT